MAKRHRWEQEACAVDGYGVWQRCTRCPALRIINAAGNIAGYKRPDGSITRTAGPCEPKTEKEADGG